MNDAPAPAPSASDPDQVKSRKRKSERARDRELADLRVVMASAEGRRFVWRLLGRCGVYRTSFDGTTSERTHFKEGERNIGLWLNAEIGEADVRSYITMQSENMMKDGEHA